MPSATNALSMAESCLAPAPALFSPKTQHPFLSKSTLKLPHLPNPLSLSASSWSSLSLKLNNKFSSFRLIPLVAQTSDWAQEEDTEQEEGGLELEARASSDEGDNWGNESSGEEVLVETQEEGGEGEGEGEGEGGEFYPEPPEEAKLYVGNLPFDVDSEKLAQLFNQAGIVEIAEVIYNRETDQSRGFGFVTMSTVEEADKAVEMFHRYDLDGRFLTVNKAAPRGSRPERQVNEPSFRIYVGNLPWQVDNTRLEQVFSEHGKVVNARVVYDRESGRSRGFGFVTMSTETELNDAIAALDGQSLDGRAIRVNVAEQRPRRNSFLF